MTKTVTVTWELPTTRESGQPLDIADIQHTKVEITADGVSFTPLGFVPPTDIQELTAADVDIGDWSFRLTVMDTANRESNPFDAPFTIADETPPSAVFNVNITMV
jgi:hypothetical protein